MKCPKCDYLGFETGDRCKHCGYDFSLITRGDSETGGVELNLHTRPVEAVEDGLDWAHWGDQPLKEPEPPLPLFTGPRARHQEDEPLIKLPVTPRPPLSVRRTPDRPRVRAIPPAATVVERARSLQFDDEAHTPRTAAPRLPSVVAIRPGSPIARIAAAAIDHLLLTAIDIGVIYFTLRITSLSMAEWAALPLGPIVFFLLLLKVSYFSAFTAVGGQTIGKMALRLRVVGEGDADVGMAVAFRRTLLGTISTSVLGLGLLPAFFDPDRRALHDRVVHTRVIAVRAA
jgi:uncharacterized RDD family membrane protein YckC